MKPITKLEIEGKTIYIKNGTQVFPIRKDINNPKLAGNIHWKNLISGGSWGKFFFTSALIIALLLTAWAYRHDTAECRKMMENPIEICNQVRINLQANLNPFQQQDFGKEVREISKTINITINGEGKKDG